MARWAIPPSSEIRSGQSGRLAWSSSGLALACLWLLFATILLLRNPAALLHAEFWAEDGWAWFPDAYRDEVASLVTPVAGYFQTFSRLAGLFAQAFPLAWAPTVFAAVALAIQALPAVFLVSARMQDAWPSPPMRLMFALLWLALPNSAEVYANLTNAQWHLAALAFLILLSSSPASRVAVIFDGVVLVLSSLSGPFCLLLLPIAAWQAARRQAGEWRPALVVATALIQGFTLLQTAAGRSPAPLGATPLSFARIVTEQVILGPLIGQAHMSRLQSLGVWQSGVLPVAGLTLAGALTLLAIWRGPALLRMACVFGALILTAAIIRPQISDTGDQWSAMQIPGVGQRYYYIPMLAWIGVLVWLVSRKSAVARLAGAVLLAAVLFGSVSDWSMPIRQPTDYAGHVKAFLRLPKGGELAFPIDPFSNGLPMVLIRK